MDFLSTRFFYYLCYNRIGLDRETHQLKRRTGIALVSNGGPRPLWGNLRSVDYKGGRALKTYFPEFSSHHRCGFFCSYLNTFFPFMIEMPLWSSPTKVPPRLYLAPTLSSSLNM